MIRASPLYPLLLGALVVVSIVALWPAPPPPPPPECHCDLPPPCECPPPLVVMEKPVPPTRADMYAIGLRVYDFEVPIMNPLGRGKYHAQYARLPAQGAVELDDEAMRALYNDTIAPLSAQFHSPLGHDGWVTRLEARILFGLVQHLRPKRVVEIGSGDSTKVLLAALPASTRITCIEPYRANEVPRDSSRVTTLVLPLQEVNVSLFTELDAGDLLFIDSSHVTVPYGDVIYEYLFLLPLVKPGVYVHVHDVFLPDDYPSVFMDELKNYTEQWLLALLLRSKEWRVVWATHYMSTRHPDLFPRDLSPRDSSFFFVRL